VKGERKNEELFIKLLDRLRRAYRCHKELHLAVDNDASHTSKRVERYVEDSDGGIHLHPLPWCSPQSNPVELVWWSLHEAVSRNHECSGYRGAGGIGQKLLRGARALPARTRRGLRAVAKVATLRSASVQLSCGPI
jgi:transposase